MPACEQLGTGRRVPARAGPARPCAPRLRGVVGGQRSAPGCSPGLCLNTPDPAGAGDRRPLSGGFSKQGICPLAQSSRGALPAQRPSLQDPSPAGAGAGACGVGCLSWVPRTLPQGGEQSCFAALPGRLTRRGEGLLGWGLAPHGPHMGAEGGLGSFLLSPKASAHLTHQATDEGCHSKAAAVSLPGDGWPGVRPPRPLGSDLRWGAWGRPGLGPMMEKLSVLPLPPVPRELRGPEMGRGPAVSPGRLQGPAAFTSTSRPPPAGRAASFEQLPWARQAGDPAAPAGRTRRRGGGGHGLQGNERFCKRLENVRQNSR